MKRLPRALQKGVIMLITFQSTASPDVVMLRDLAQYLLGLIGKRLDDRGVITHAELPGAIGRLEAAISDDAKTEATVEPLHCSASNHSESRNRLSQRAWPFLDMMREARKSEADIIWGL
ncbi:hypothetical protein LMG28614_00305 [Paraburkholderia ultramafica]|uniref:DUF1840 domain-containing protein n=2 Tax=Paraburkholderia ultramafica TaxID=1544867 RepID=A0A6S7AT10_9BURK|nr:hypothetical protein LMG28614_00305 [Paraburkholderia ultramafica]